MKVPAILGRVLHSRKATEQRPPPILSAAERFPYGAFRFDIKIEKGLPFEIQASPDLTNWIQISADTAPSPLVQYVDSQAHNFSARFYRVFTGPQRSANIIGYASTTVPPGFSLIANPFNAGPAALEDLFKRWPEGTSVSRFDTRFFKLVESTFKNGHWTLPREKLLPGDGAIFFNPTDDYKSVNFTGQVAEGSSSEPVPAGFSIRSSMIPRFGHLQESLGFPISNGDVIHLFDRDRQQYVLHPFENGAWTAGAPIISLCEAFWVAKAEPSNWKQTLTIEN